LTILLEATLRAAYHASRQSHKWWKSNQVHTCILSSYPLVNHNIGWPQSISLLLWISQEIHICLLLYIYFYSPKNIKKEIPNEVMSIFKVWKLYIMICIALQIYDEENKPHQYGKRYKFTVLVVLGFLKFSVKKW
jgi:hypothetical protein